MVANSINLNIIPITPDIWLVYILLIPSNAIFMLIILGHRLFINFIDKRTPPSSIIVEVYNKVMIGRVQRLLNERLIQFRLVKHYIIVVLLNFVINI